MYAVESLGRTMKVANSLYSIIVGFLVRWRPIHRDSRKGEWPYVVMLVVAVALFLIAGPAGYTADASYGFVDGSDGYALVDGGCYVQPPVDFHCMCAYVIFYGSVTRCWNENIFSNVNLQKVGTCLNRHQASHQNNRHQNNRHQASHQNNRHQNNRHQNNRDQRAYNIAQYSNSHQSVNQSIQQYATDVVQEFSNTQLYICKLFNYGRGFAAKHTHCAFAILNQWQKRVFFILESRRH